MKGRAETGDIVGIKQVTAMTPPNLRNCCLTRATKCRITWKTRPVSHREHIEPMHLVRCCSSANEEPFAFEVAP